MKPSLIAITTSVGAGKIGAERREHFLERRDHEDHDDRQHAERHDEHGRRVDQRGLDLLLDRDGLFLVQRQAGQQFFQDTAGFAGLDQVAVQRVEVLRMLAKGRGQARAGLDVAADLVEQARHARVGAAAADDVEGLQQRHAGLHHRRQLAREDGDVLAA
jgi:uncharacterized protein YerC